MQGFHPFRSVLHVAFCNLFLFSTGRIKPQEYLVFAYPGTIHVSSIFRTVNDISVIHLRSVAFGVASIRTIPLAPCLFPNTVLRL